jgi:hypothetical protein
MRKLFGILSALVMGVSLSVGGMVATANSAEAAGNYARCNNGITLRDWTGKDPRDCTPSGTYWLYNSAGTPIMKLQQAPHGSPLWNAIKQGYTATQNWCSNNSATCGIVTSVGVTALWGLLDG